MFYVKPSLTAEYVLIHVHVSGMIRNLIESFFCKDMYMTVNDRTHPIMGVPWLPWLHRVAELFPK